jgi:hypothetical protein
LLCKNFNNNLITDRKNLNACKETFKKMALIYGIRDGRRKLVPPARIELATPGLGKRRSGVHQGLKIPDILLNIKYNLGFSVSI